MYHHTVLDLDDDRQLGYLESHPIRYRLSHLDRMYYFLAGSTAFVAAGAAGAALLAGVVSAFLASTLQVLSLAGSHFAGVGVAAALAAGAGAAAGVAVLAGSVAKAAVATKVAIRVAIVFI